MRETWRFRTVPFVLFALLSIFYFHGDNRHFLPCFYLPQRRGTLPPCRGDFPPTFLKSYLVRRTFPQFEGLSPLTRKGFPPLVFSLDITGKYYALFGAPAENVTSLSECDTYPFHLAAKYVLKSVLFLPSNALYHGLFVVSSIISILKHICCIYTYLLHLSR